MSSSIKYVKWIHVIWWWHHCVYIMTLGVVKMQIIKYEEKTGADPENILSSFWTRTN